MVTRLICLKFVIKLILSIFSSRIYFRILSCENRVVGTVEFSILLCCNLDITSVLRLNNLISYTGTQFVGSLQILILHPRISHLIRMILWQMRVALPGSVLIKQMSFSNRALKLRAVLSILVVFLLVEARLCFM